jgi:4-carboxymuconolactone decarboxylase
MNDTGRFDRGRALLERMFGETADKTLASLETTAPDLGRYVVEFVFGDVFSRPGLDLKSREIATVAALTALGSAGPQLRAHIRGALSVGLSEAEIVEIIMQMAVYAGFPAALNGIQAAREVFAERAAGKP